MAMEIVWPAENDIISKYVFAREIQGKQPLRKRRRAVQGIAARSFPLLNPQKAIEFSDVQQCDKIFASCWLDSSTVAMGSKDNQFIIWDVFGNTHKKIPIPQVGSAVPIDSCGIHDVDVNRSQTLIATGGHSPLDILVFSRDTMLPKCLLKGHNDWVFGAKFLEDDVLVSASRDSAVALWKVPTTPDPSSDPPALPEVAPLLTRKEHSSKVRAIGYHRPKQQVATLSADSILKIWDRSNMDVVASLEFVDYNEMTCMAVDQTHDLIVVGHQEGICVVDMRGPVCAMEIINDHNRWGIRSVDIFHHFVSIGGGFGRLYFYDLRNKSYVEMNSNGKVSLKTRNGWIDGMGRHTEFDGRHAIYSNKFDPSGGRLLVAGGPIMHNAKGSYAAVW